jgi:hypothetical protein
VVEHAGFAPGFAGGKANLFQSDVKKEGTVSDGEFTLLNREVRVSSRHHERLGGKPSVMKDIMGKAAAFGQAAGGMANSDEIVKGAMAS